MSLTAATSGVVNGCPTVADCPFPEAGVTVAGGPGSTVSLNVVPTVAPPVVAVVALRVTGPEVVPAVKVGELARPSAPVVAVTLDAPPPKVAEPELTVNVTTAPATGLPALSVTAATSGAPNGCPAMADCPSPEATVTVAGVTG